MAISTYAELSTAVADWLHRTDLTSRVPDFITIGEATLNRKLRLLQMESVSALSTSITDRFATLPAGFSEAIDLTLYNDDYPQTLTQLPLVKINGFSRTEAGLPKFYAISSNIIFDVISDQVYSCSLRYYKSLDIATDLTNFVLTDYPDLYLYSALLAAAPFINNDNRIATWSQLLNDGIKATNRLDGRTRGKSMLTLEAGIRHYRDRGDIITGEA